MAAANWLEATVLDDHLGDDRFDDFLEALALYRPNSGPPYVAASELRDLIRSTITD